MTTDNVNRLAQLTRQLSETLVTAAYCAEEIRTLVHVEPAHDQAAQDRTPNTSRPSANGRPLLDQSTFSVTWHGKSLRLGHTRSFWLLARLARRPNQYVSHLDLLNEVWDDEELTTATIRSTVCQLRRRLRRCGMRALATAIRGHNGHYILVV